METSPYKSCPRFTYSIKRWKSWVGIKKLESDKFSMKSLKTYNRGNVVATVFDCILAYLQVKITYMCWNEFEIGPDLRHIMGKMVPPFFGCFCIQSFWYFHVMRTCSFGEFRFQPDRRLSRELAALECLKWFSTFSWMPLIRYFLNLHVMRTNIILWMS